MQIYDIFLVISSNHGHILHRVGDMTLSTKNTDYILIMTDNELNVIILIYK